MLLATALAADTQRSVAAVGTTESGGEVLIVFSEWLSPFVGGVGEAVRRAAVPTAAAAAFFQMPEASLPPHEWNNIC